jgi:hypothetical protein
VIWKLAKFYKTPNERIISSFDTYNEGLNVLNWLNTEDPNLQLQLFFEDLAVSSETKKLGISRFTFRESI